MRISIIPWCRKLEELASSHCLRKKTLRVVPWIVLNEKGLFQIAWPPSGALEFFARKWQHGETIPTASSRTASRRLRQDEILRAGENKSSRPRVAIVLALEVDRKIGCSLDLIQHRALAEFQKEPPRVSKSPRTNVVCLQSTPGEMPEYARAKGGIPGLSRPGARENRPPLSRSIDVVR